MKASDWIFKKPVKVLQVFRQVIYYSKSERSFTLRAYKTGFNKVLSKSGYVNNGQLYLPETIKEHPRMNGSDLLTIEDDISGEIDQVKQMCNHFYSLHHPVRFHIFELQGEPSITLGLRYSETDIGIPKRSNFTIAELNLNEAVAIRINGKTDFSLTGRRSRVFKEQHYVIQYLGEFKKCNLIREPFAAWEKEVVYTKMVDLIKPLW